MTPRLRNTLEDVASFGVILAPAAYAVNRARRSEGAFDRAVRNAAVAAIAGGITGGIGNFVEFHKKHRGEDVLKDTAFGCGILGLMASVAAGLTSLIWDAFHPKKRYKRK